MRPSSLRILHVSNFGYFPKGPAHYGVPARLSNGWVRAGHNVITFSERDIARWFGFGARKLGRFWVNRVLREVAEAVKPDVIALGHADNIAAKTVLSIREQLPNVKVLQYTADAIYDDKHGSDTMGRQLGKLAVVDASFVTMPGEALRPLEHGGKIAAFFPNPVDASIDRVQGFENPNPEFDLVFVSGSGLEPRFHAGVWRTPEAMAALLLEQIPDLRPAFGGVRGQPHIFRDAFEALTRKSRMGFNLSRRNNVYLYSSDRMAFFAGAGLVVVTDRASGFADLVGEDSCCLYSTEEELFARVRALKADDAQARALAERGWRKFYELFDSKIVGQYMLDLLLGESVQDYPWPSRPGTMINC